MKCDVFISYRRDGGDMTAMYIYQALKDRGYDVFYDLEVLRAGRFNDALLENIRSCKDFLLILSPHALDRCSDEHDWVRREIAEALRCRKNIIPVMLNGFVFPESLPAEIDNVRYQNGLTATTEYFMESVNRLCSRYLDSRPKKKKVNTALIVCICIAAAALACAGVLGWQLLKQPEEHSGNQVNAAVETEAPEPTAEPAEAAAAESTAAPVLSGTDLPRLRGDYLSGRYTDNWSECPVFENESLARWEISSVSFVSTLEGMPEDAWDVSEDGSGSVMAWIARNGSLYDLYIGGEGGVAISDGSELFCGYENLSSVSFNGCVDLSGCSNLRAMFEFCYSLESIDLNGLDTSHVIDMAAMFHGCHSLKHIDLSMLNTSNVEQMHMLFEECIALESVNLTGLDTSHVQDMNQMFRCCWSLKELDVSGFDTLRVRNMCHMFEGCEALTSLDLSSWNTGRVEAMNGMFLSCANLTDLNVSGWDTRSVTVINSMFMNCPGLTTLDLSSFDTSAVSDMMNLFMNCSSLEELDLTAWNTAGVTSMESMFDGCRGLRTLTLPDGFVGPGVITTVHMFCRCSQLESINTGGWDTSNVSDMLGMFEGCWKLSQLDVSGWNTSGAENMGYLFNDCSSLSGLDLNGWDVSRVTDMTLMFWNCPIEQLDISSWDVSNVRSYEGMFENCANLNLLRLPENFVHEKVENTRALFNNCLNLPEIAAGGWNTSSVTDMCCMFNECQNLKELDVSGWNVSSVTDMSYMFAGCEQLQHLDISAWNMENTGSTECMFDRCAYQPGT